MSLVMHVEFPGSTPEEVRLLAERGQREFGLSVKTEPRPTAFGLSSPAVALTDAHEALTDQAHWNAAFWDMDPDGACRLAHIVSTLYNFSPRGIAVRAIWVSDKVRERKTLSIEQMVEVLRQGRLGTHTRYEVPKRA